MRHTVHDRRELLARTHPTRKRRVNHAHTKAALPAAAIGFHYYTADFQPPRRVTHVGWASVRLPLLTNRYQLFSGRAAMPPSRTGIDAGSAQ